MTYRRGVIETRARRPRHKERELVNPNSTMVERNTKDRKVLDAWLQAAMIGAGTSDSDHLCFPNLTFPFWGVVLLMLLLLLKIKERSGGVPTLRRKEPLMIYAGDVNLMCNRQWKMGVVCKFIYTCFTSCVNWIEFPFNSF